MSLRDNMTLGEVRRALDRLAGSEFESTPTNIVSIEKRLNGMYFVHFEGASDDGRVAELQRQIDDLEDTISELKQEIRDLKNR